MSRPDDLTRIRGIDPELAEKLRRIGITHYEQIAEWSATDVRSLSAALKLERRIYSQAWIEQAARLAQRARHTEPGHASLPRLASAAPANAAPETPPAQRSIASLVTAAAAAIRARIRMMPAEADADAMIPPKIETAPEASAKQDLAAKIAAAFHRIREKVASNEATIPDTDPIRAPQPDPEPPQASDDGPEAPAVPAGQTALEWEAKLVSPPQPATEIGEGLQSTPALQGMEPAEVIAAPRSQPRPPDELCLIDDLPPRVADRLNELGVFYFSEIAAFDAGDIETLSTECVLGDRITRENWIEQAAMLASGRATKASKNRLNGKPLRLAPYPAAPLIRNSRAFAALIRRSPATRPPWRPAAPELPKHLAPTSASAPQPEQPPSPFVSEAAAPAPSPEAQPTGTCSPAADGVPAEREPEPEAKQNPEPARKSPVAMPRDETPSANPEDLEQYNSTYEEAEVIITARVRQNTEEPRAPASSSSPSAAPPQANEEDDHAAYIAHISEATVDIVKARPRTTPPDANAVTRQRMPELRAEESRIEPPRSRRRETGSDSGGVEQRAIDRFLKALRGR